MTSVARSALVLPAALALLGALPAVLANMPADTSAAANMDMDAIADAAKPDPGSVEPSYFSLAEHRGVIYAHVALMCLAWVVMLPMAVMLSLARSRLTLPVQFVFLATNALALILGISYNASTPDLYPNNAHHKIGWVASWIVAAQVLVGLVGRFAGVMERSPPKPRGEEHRAFIPVSTQAMAEHQSLNDSIYLPKYRHSHDSGQGTEPHTESLRSNSVSTPGNHSPHHPEDQRMDYEEEDEEDIDLKSVELGPSRDERPPLLSKISGKISGRTWQFLLFGYNLIDRTILILGYVALATGIITWGRFFEGHGIFNGLAHWIKGSVFFWLGIFTIGRWSGSFGELGWAWNVRPKQASARWIPSAEFVEGFLIFLYGSTNVFLEHLGSASLGRAEFSPTDLEHVSITVLFIGGGALAMLIESVNIRELLNTTVSEVAFTHPAHSYSEEEREALQSPRQYEFSVNPIPALVILLTGIMMSSHTQDTMLSSMIHKQWGDLLAFAAVSRGFTYLLMYLRPPRSVMPSRPPTELIAAFGLMSGGVIFCASSADTVTAMALHDLDAMFFYTVTMGLIGLTMAWVVLMLALKGWAVRREAGKAKNAWHAAARV